MDKSLTVFDERDFGQVRFLVINEKPYAVGIDVAKGLDYKEPHKAVASHCRGGISYPVIDNLGRTQETIVIPEGDIFRLIIKAADQSRNPEIKEKALRYEKWIFDTVLPSIRKNGSYIADSVETKAQRMPELKIDGAALEIAFNLLKPSENSKLMLVQKLFDKHGMDKNLLPVYTEKVRPIFSASKLLLKINSDLSIRQFNAKMIACGYLEKKTRQSRKTESKTKDFLVLTEKGLAYGQNDVSPQNPLETQPHYYEDTFGDLVRIITIN